KRDRQRQVVVFRFVDVRLDAVLGQELRRGIESDAERVTRLQVIGDRQVRRVPGRRLHRHVIRRLGRLNFLGIRRDVRVHESRRPLHVVLQLVDFVLDDLLLETAAPPAAALRLLLRRRRAWNRRLLDLAVGAVGAILLLLLLHFTLHRDRRGLDPRVLTKRLLIRRERFLERGDAFLRRGRLRLLRDRRRRVERRREGERQDEM